MAIVLTGAHLAHTQPLPLLPGEIHLWISDYRAIDDEQLLQRYGHLLDEGERRRQQRFYFADDRQRDLVTRALVRCVLSRYEPMDPRAWRFELNAYGRPAIAAHGGEAPLVFNISHTRSLILLGLTRGGALGVDIENTTTRTAPIALAHRYFAPAEVAALGALPEVEQTARFWDYWTLKESYIKARGMGLSLPLDRFSFHFPTPGAVHFQTDPALADDAGRWRFWLFSPAPCYVAAVCAERSDTPAGLIVTETTPLRGSAPRALTLLRLSSV